MHHGRRDELGEKCVCMGMWYIYRKRGQHVYSLLMSTYVVPRSIPITVPRSPSGSDSDADSEAAEKDAPSMAIKRSVRNFNFNMTSCFGGCNAREWKAIEVVEVVYVGTVVRKVEGGCESGGQWVLWTWFGKICLNREIMPHQGNFRFCKSAHFRIYLRSFYSHAVFRKAGSDSQ